MDEYNIQYDEVAIKFLDLIDDLKALRPEERSELARRIAVTVTETEKAYAYFMHMVKHS